MNPEREVSAEQREQIKAKVEELKAVHASVEGGSREQRRRAMQAKHDELRSWAEENGIPLDLLPPRRGPSAG